VITDATFWQQSPEVREEQIPGLDPHCLICGKPFEGQPFEGQPFFWDLFMGPQIDMAGMHLRCAYFLSMHVLRDLAADWHLNTTELKRFVDTYDEDRQARAPRPPDIPAS